MLTDQCSHWLCAGLLAALAAMHPWAAIGAAFGCCFVMAYPPKNTSYLARVALILFSWGVGYAHGVWWFPAGPPYDPSAMLPAVALSAVGVVLGLAAVRMMEHDGPLPAWLEGILGHLPLIKRKGGDNDL